MRNGFPQHALANSWGDLHGATAYITAMPCLNCIKELGQRGVSRIVYAGRYDNKDDGRVLDYCRQGKIELVQFANDAKVIALVEMDTIKAKIRTIFAQNRPARLGGEVLR